MRVNGSHWLNASRTRLPLAIVRVCRLLVGMFTEIARLRAVIVHSQLGLGFSGGESEYYHPSHAQPCLTLLALLRGASRQKQRNSVAWLPANSTGFDPVGSSLGLRLVRHAALCLIASRKKEDMPPIGGEACPSMDEQNTKKVAWL